MPPAHLPSSRLSPPCLPTSPFTGHPPPDRLRASPATPPPGRRLPTSPSSGHPPPSHLRASPASAFASPHAYPSLLCPLRLLVHPDKNPGN
ncbi:hypothetical protein GUJ93_ZPchr0006g46444 [Zizania palustris]|uniref:Uncharacterized protein n=1 Tax=Zizania palustris TaxID=103762 RepID=A0A8J5S768_ZIZPA|nr:hypothetical protein GUJ93_ZPchr0006g46444 [Zizania palustris]